MVARLKLMIFVLAVLLLPHVALADAFDDGVAAYVRGDYKTAFRGFKGLAEQGDALAQSDLGVMYDQGAGVTPNYKEAVRWYSHAADQGDAKAQYNLGLMYDMGQGVPKDFVTAYMWFILSSADGDEKAVKACDGLAKEMNPAQFAPKSGGPLRSTLRSPCWNLASRADFRS